MSKKRHKLLARKKGDHVQVRMLLMHPMETGNRVERATGQKVSRHFIKELQCIYLDKVVLSSHWGWGVSKNPYLSFELLHGEKGENITVTWVDNLGVSEKITTTIK